MAFIGFAVNLCIARILLILFSSLVIPSHKIQIIRYHTYCYSMEIYKVYEYCFFYSGYEGKYLTENTYEKCSYGRRPRVFR